MDSFAGVLKLHTDQSDTLDAIEIAEFWSHCTIRGQMVEFHNDLNLIIEFRYV